MSTNTTSANTASTSTETWHDRNSPVMVSNEIMPKIELMASGLSTSKKDVTQRALEFYYEKQYKADQAARQAEIEADLQAKEEAAAAKQAAKEAAASEKKAAKEAAAAKTPARKTSNKTTASNAKASTKKAS